MLQSILRTLDNVLSPPKQIQERGHPWKGGAGQGIPWGRFQRRQARPDNKMPLVTTRVSDQKHWTFDLQMARLLQPPVGLVVLVVNIGIGIPLKGLLTGYHGVSKYI